MASEWRESTIGALCDAGVAELQTGPFGTQLHACDYVPDGVPVVPTEAIRGGRIDHTALPRISRKKAEELARHRLRLGDILFARRGAQATGHVAWVREAEDGFICGTGAIRLRINHMAGPVEPGFLSHVLADPASVEWFKFHAIGATMPNLNEGIIRSFSTPIPTMPEQRVMTHILGTLDDKIELNRRMNETLEAMARAIFKSWFVDFDPVRAKAEGRKSAGMDAGTAALFPDSFEGSYAERPAGWSTGTFLDIGELLSGGTPKTNEPAYWNGDMPWASAQDVSQCGAPFLVETSRTITSRGIEESATQLIPALSTVVVARGATTGRHAMFGRPMAMNQTCYGLKAKAGDDYFLYCLFGSEVDGLVNAAHGSVFDTITTSTFRSSELVVPPAEIRLRFNVLTAPVFEIILANLEESRTLAALRDALLPKLLSGELRVGEGIRLGGHP